MKDKLEKQLADLKFRRMKLIKEKAASPMEIANKMIKIQQEITKVEEELKSK